MLAIVENMSQVHVNFQYLIEGILFLYAYIKKYIYIVLSSLSFPNCSCMLIYSSTFCCHRHSYCHDSCSHAIQSQLLSCVHANVPWQDFTNEDAVGSRNAQGTHTFQLNTMYR